MHKLILTLIAGTIALFLSCPFVLANNAGFNVLMNNGNGKIVDNGDIIIHSDEGGNAHITAHGKLSINGKAVSVTESQKTQLTEYVATIKDIEIQGVQLGKDAAGFAANIVADVFSGLFTGEDQDKIDNQAQARAHIFKQKTLPLCKDVQVLKSIQAGLAAGIAAFKPYAVIKNTDAHDCQHDINSEN